MSPGKQIYYHLLRENLKNMHPKFKELAVQAGAYPEGNTVLVGPMDVAKFAELIVKECAKIVRNSFVIPKTNKARETQTICAVLILCDYITKDFSSTTNNQITVSP